MQIEVLIGEVVEAIRKVIKEGTIKADVYFEIGNTPLEANSLLRSFRAFVCLPNSHKTTGKVVEGTILAETRIGTIPGLVDVLTATLLSVDEVIITAHTGELKIPQGGCGFAEWTMEVRPKLPQSG